MQSVGLPEKTLNIINRKLYTFIWKRKYDNKKAFQKVKCKVLTKDIDKRGLKMVDMKSHQNALLELGAKINGKQHRQTQLENTSNSVFLQIRKRLRHFQYTLWVDRPYWDAKTYRRILEKCCTNMAET